MTMTATKKPAKPAAKKPSPAKATKPAMKAAKPKAEPSPVAPPYPGYEPYDVVQVCDDGTWSDFETIRTPEEGEQARKMCELTGPRTYRIVAGNKQTVKVAPPEPTPAPEKKAKKKAAPDAKPKKLSALDAAAKVLAESGQAMTCQEMIDAMAAKGYWTSPGGKTPSATLYSAILREVANKGEQARFTKTERGKFASAGAK